MPGSIQEMRERRNAFAKDTRNLLDVTKGEQWTDENQKQYDSFVAEIERADAAIAREQKILDLDAERAFEADVETVLAERKGMSPKGGLAKMIAKFSAKMKREEGRSLLAEERTGIELFDKWVRDEKSLTSEEWTQIRNTMSTTTGSEGGFTVPSLISSDFYDLMKAFGTMRTTSDNIRTTDGKPLSYPTTDGTAETGEIIAQNATANSADLVFGSASLNVFKFSSKIVAVPFELLQDSIIDIEKLVLRRLAQRIGRIGNTKFTVGAGTTEPDGVVPRSSSGKVGLTGQTLTIIYDDVIDLVHSVDPAYRGAGAAFMTNDSLLKVLRKIKDTTGRPIWTPSWDGGMRIGMGAPGQAQDGGFRGQEQPVIFDLLVGYPVWVNNDIAVPAANAKSMIFGNLPYYIIRDAMDVTFFRFTDSAYTKLGQVGFLAWARMGGNLIDTTAIKYYQHSAT
jgi:HK97 family phage major capsid protein